MWTRFHFLLGSGLLAITSPAYATFQFSTGTPDGRIATASQPGGGGQVEIETADDFVLTQETLITNGTFTGLVPPGTDATDIGNVVIEIYRVFPLDSTNPPSGNVPTRNNSPSDVAFTSANLSLGQLAVTTSTLSAIFTASNSVVSGINGINSLPGVFTGGEGPVSGQETLFTFSLTTPFDLAAGHYFFVPQVQLSTGNFLWLSAAHPVVAPGTPFPNGFTDLQTWIRNGSLAPDWLRVGTDITQQGPFNAAFSLNGVGVPEPETWTMMLAGFAGLGLALRRQRRKLAAA
ncbi:MAG: PEPxxWA-CTERM sorting domain-containing protein [Sphingomicrobium sp.]